MHFGPKALSTGKMGLFGHASSAVHLLRDKEPSQPEGSVIIYSSLIFRRIISCIKFTKQMSKKTQKGFKLLKTER